MDEQNAQMAEVKQNLADKVRERGLRCSAWHMHGRTGGTLAVTTTPLETLRYSPPTDTHRWRHGALTAHVPRRP